MYKRQVPGSAKAPTMLNSFSKSWGMPISLLQWTSTPISHKRICRRRQKTLVWTWSWCKKKGESAFYKQIRLSYCFIRFRRVSRKSCRKVVVTRFFVVNDLFSTALLLPEYCHPASKDLSLPVRHTRTLRKSAYPRNQYPSSFSAAGLWLPHRSYQPALPARNTREYLSLIHI